MQSYFLPDVLPVSSKYRLMEHADSTGSGREV